MAVTCSYSRRTVRVGVRDDGRGFDPVGPTPAGHWGQVGMRERAASIGATLTVTSAPGAGTDVVLLLPLREGERTRWRWRRRVPPERG